MQMLPTGKGENYATDKNNMNISSLNKIKNNNE
jgi:hypothetical protein